MKRICLAVAAVVLSASAAAAQTIPGQDATLTGLRSVALAIDYNVGDDSIAVRDGIALELRKAGIRVVPADTPAVNGGLIFRIRKRGTYSGSVRVELLQRATLERTKLAVRTVMTWTYVEEEDSRAGRAAWFRDATKRGLDAFLTKWLDANGR